MSVTTEANSHLMEVHGWEGGGWSAPQLDTIYFQQHFNRLKCSSLQSSQKSQASAPHFSVHKQSWNSCDHDQRTVLACAKYCTTGFCSIFATLPKMLEEKSVLRFLYGGQCLKATVCNVTRPLSNYVPMQAVTFCSQPLSYQPNTAGKALPQALQRFCKTLYTAVYLVSYQDLCDLWNNLSA